jgi:hypothetical protein
MSKARCFAALSMTRYAIRNTLHASQIMQNKANFKEFLMDVTAVKTRCYEKRTLGGFGKTNPKQTQFKAKTKPILPRRSPSPSEGWVHEAGFLS